MRCAKVGIIALVCALFVGCQVISIEEETHILENPLTVMVPMPDGVSLATTVYLPRDDSGPWPTLLVRTPYGRIILPDFIEYFLRCM